MQAKAFRAMFIVGILVAGVGVSMVGSAVETPEDMFARVEADVARVAAENPGGMGTRTTYTVDGPVTVAISSEEFLETARMLIKPGMGDEPRSHPGATIGQGNAASAARSGWRFCDYASIFQYYYGNTPGQHVVAAVPAGPSTGTVCGGFYGPTQNWALVQMAPPANKLLACGAAVVMIPHADTQVGSTGGYRCNANSLAATGQGALYSDSFFGLTIDYFLGYDATIVVS